MPRWGRWYLTVLAVWGGFTLTEALAAEQPAGPYAYGPRSSQIARASEAPFVETEESRRYGFDVPFPAGPRRAFRVEDYGGRPDGQTDCTPAFYQALAAAKSCGQPAEVVFGGRGRYRLVPHPELGSDDMAVLNVREADNLVIRGQGHETVLLVTDPALGGLNIRRSQVVMVRDLALDYDPLPFTQGQVVALDQPAGTFVLRLTPGYPTPAEINARIPGTHGGYRLAAAGPYKWPSITPLMPRGIERTAEGDWRFQAAPAALQGYLRVGDEFIYVGRRIAQVALGAMDTRGFYVQHVAVHASPTCGLVLMNADGVNIAGYADTIPEGSGRLLASNADGLYVHGARGGLTVRDSYFMGQGDDCINLHCPGFRGAQVTVHSDTELTLQGPVDVRPGDPLELMDPASGIIRGQVTVSAATRAPDGQSVRCQLRETLSSRGFVAATDFVFPAALAAPRFKLVHNYFGQNRSRCLLIQARDGLIAGNTAENAEGYGVILSYGGTVWREGVVPARVTIRDNVFRNVTGVGLAGAVEIGDGTPQRNFHDITIAGNRFYNTRKMAVTAAGCVGLTLSDNEVATEPQRRNIWNHPEWYPVDCSVYLRNCAGVLLDGFRLRDPNVTAAGIYVDKTCDPGPAGVTLRGVDCALPEGVPAIMDQR